MLAKVLCDIAVSFFHVFSPGKCTKLAQHTALPEDSPSLPDANDTVGLNPFINLDLELIEQTCLALNAAPSGWPSICHTSGPEPSMSTSSQGPTLHSVSSHPIHNDVVAPPGPPSSPPAPLSHAHSTCTHTHALEDA